MSCERIQIGDTTMIVCGVRRGPARKCSTKGCGRNASRQCDFPVGKMLTGEPITCDAYICTGCATIAGPEIDHCPKHSGVPAPKLPPAITWPATNEQLCLAGYRFMYSRKCRLCDAVLEFWKTPKGKESPLEKQGPFSYVSHFATCPKADEFRKGK